MRKQWFLFSLGLLVMISVAWYLSRQAGGLAGAWLFGIIFGFTLQRSRFCMASMLRDYFLFGFKQPARALFLLMLVTTIGFTIVRVWRQATGHTLVGYWEPWGWGTVIGGLLFGLGMVLAGGCASGMLMRMGEGYAMQWLAFIAFLLGTGLAVWLFPWWQQALRDPVDLATRFPLWGLATTQIAILTLIWYKLRGE
ncbi:MAG: YeeE/YedE thiosulfate transporter family protein [Bacillota bacterium]